MTCSLRKIVRWNEKFIVCLVKLTYTTFEIINNACFKCGIEDRISMHGLRKTFGYHHYQQFHDVAILQYLLNHSSPSITLRYIGITQDTVEETLKEFELWYTKEHPFWGVLYNLNIKILLYFTFFLIISTLSFCE